MRNLFPPRRAQAAPALLALILMVVGADAADVSGDWKTFAVTTSDGLEIPAIWKTPAGDGPFPAIVYFHGAPGGYGEEKLRESATQERWQRFLDAGYVVVLGDYRGHPQDQPFEIFRGKVTAGDDAAAIIDKVKELPGVDGKRVAAMGGSLGGITALEAVAKTDVICYVGNAPASFPFANEPEMQSRLDTIQCPILIIQGTADTLTPVNQRLVDALNAKGKNIRFELFENQAHNFTINVNTEQGAKALAMTLKFLAQNDPKSGAAVARTEERTAPAAARETPPAQTPEEFMPKILDDNRVTFTLKAADAQSVKLQGLPGGDTALAKNDAGAWSVTVGPLAPGIYQYSFDVDGAHVADPKNPNIAVNANVNGPCLSSVFEIAGPEPMYYDPRPVPHGAIHIVFYESKIRKNPQQLFVHTPPDYDRNAEQTYPTLYLFHGGGFDESSWSDQGRANWILDNLIAEGNAKPMLVVMPLGGVPGEFGDSLKQMPGEICDSIIPFVDANFRARADADSRAVIGFSMGGAQSLMTGLMNLDRFHWVGGMGSAVHTPASRPAMEAVKADPAKAKELLRLVWMGWGKQDFLFEANQTFAGDLKDLGLNVVVFNGPGGHTWDSWRPFLKEFASRIFQ